MPTSSNRRPLADWWGAVLLGAVTILVFTRVGILVFNHGSTPLDGAVRLWMVDHQSPPAVKAFTWITTIGTPQWLYVFALGAAAFLWVRKRRRVALRCLAAPLAAMLLYEAAKRIYARARPPGIGGVTEGAFSFPSAHATASAAVCGTLAYVFWREGFIDRWTGLIVALVLPLVIGFSRLYLDRHWTTDVIGGWSAGYLIAALSIALYKRRNRTRTVAAHRRAAPAGAR